jgi:Fe(3+) dicitrate transport protein
MFQKINLIHIINIVLFVIMMQGSGYSRVQKGSIIGYFSDTITVKGYVTSSSGYIIESAVVEVDGTSEIVFSDKNGMFSIKLFSGIDYVFKVSATGYKAVEISILSQLLNSDQLNIVMEEMDYLVPEILILGKADRIFRKIPGSVSYLSRQLIDGLQPVSGNEVFRTSPGVHIADEDGPGLRLNLGIRGLDPDRSRSVLILEDGIPVALAPYGEPEMYYTPVMDRMKGVEILKGSGQILFGPQTIGGVINYLSLSPPENFEGKIKSVAGQGGYFNNLIQCGNTIGNIGYQVSLLHKRAEKLVNTGFNLSDLTSRLVFNFSEKSSLTVKTAFYHESSNASYIGLTQTMFDAGNDFFTLMAPDDRLEIRRYSLGLIHQYQVHPSLKVVTTAYAYSTTRNWRRQDFVLNAASNDKPSHWTGVTWGDESIQGGAVFMRNSTGNRNRQFAVAGIQSTVELKYDLFRFSNELKAGLRYHHEGTNEQRINGTKYNVKSGNLIDDEQRSGDAWSFFFQNQTDLSERFTLNLGLRTEYFNYSRDIYRGTFRINGVNAVRDTFIGNEGIVKQVIPGAGLNFKVSDKTRIFGGIHTGFAPPRTKDAISNVGEVYELEAEKSINSELGIRSQISRNVFTELTLFSMNFSNQVIPVSESSGGTGAGLVNGGSTLHRGVEFALVTDISGILKWNTLRIQQQTSLTLTDARFTGDRFIGGENLSGNKTPYAPSMLLNTVLSIEHMSGPGCSFVWNSVSEQFTDKINSILPSPDGRSGMIPAYQLLDVNLFYNVWSWNTKFSFSIKNITDERFIVNRRPQGIRVGMPRYFSGGVEISF